MQGQNLGNWIAEREHALSPEGEQMQADLIRHYQRRRRRNRAIAFSLAAILVLTVVLVIRRVSEYRRLVMNTFGEPISAIEFEPYPGKGFVRIQDGGQIQWIRQALSDAIPDDASPMDAPCELRIVRPDGTEIAMKIGVSGPTIGPNGAINAGGANIALQWGHHRRTFNNWALATAYQQATDPKPQPNAPATNAVAAPGTIVPPTVVIRKGQMAWAGMPGATMALDPAEARAIDLHERVQWLTKEKAIGPASFLLSHLLSQYPKHSAADLRPNLDSAISIRLTSLLAQLEIALNRGEAPFDRAVYLRHRDELIEATWLAPPNDPRLQAFREKLDKRRPPLDVTKLKEIQTLKGDGSDFYSIRSLAFSRDGARIAAACSDGMLRLWDAQSGYLVLRLNTGPASAVAFLPDPQRIYLFQSAREGSRHTIWNLLTGAEEHTSPQRESAVATRTTGDSSRLLAVFPEDAPALWRLADEPPTMSNPLPIRKEINSDAVISADGRRIALIGEGAERPVALHDLDKGKGIEIGAVEWTAVTAFTADGAFFIAAQLSNTLRAWDAQTGETADPTKLFSGRIFSDQFARDGLVALQPLGVRALLFDASTGREITSLRHSAPVQRALFSPDGDQILGQTPTSLHIWSNPY